MNKPPTYRILIPGMGMTDVYAKPEVDEYIAHLQAKVDELQKRDDYVLGCLV